MPTVMGSKTSARQRPKKRAKGQPQAEVIALRQGRSGRRPLAAIDPQTGLPKGIASLRKPSVLPLWFRCLVVMHRTSAIAAFVMVVAVLGAYGWTVYSQQLWGRTYDRLEHLRRNERQLTANNELLKNQLARQAERPDSGFVPQSPNNTIFLTPAPQRQPLAVPAEPEAPEATSMPLGY